MTHSGDDQLRIGLVGGGHWAATVHAPAIAAHPATRLAGVWARRHEAAKEIAGDGAVYGSFAELVADVDAVAFAVPPAVQAPLAVAAAAAGRHLICEKPLAESVEDARAVADAAAGVVTSLVLTLRHDADVRAWLAGLPDGPAPADSVACARWLSGSLLGGPYATSTWRADADNGALLDLGPHVVDLLEAALGPVTDVAWAHRAEPDLWSFGLAHAGGAHSSATLSLRLPVDPSEIEIATFGGIGTHVLKGGVADAKVSYAALLDEFVCAVRGGPAPAAGAARGMRLQEIVDGVRALALAR